MKETLKSQPYNHADDFDISLCQDKMVEKLENSFVNHFHTISPVCASLDFKLSFPFSKFLTFLLNHLKKNKILLSEDFHNYTFFPLLYASFISLPFWFREALIFKLAGCL